MSDNIIQKQRETWFLTNTTNIPLKVTDIPSLPVLKPGDRINAMDYTNREAINQSIVLRSYISQGLITTEDYLHTHDDKADKDHHIEDHEDTTATGKDLNILTGGIESDADELHTHNNKSNINHTIVSHPDTDASGEQLNKLTDGSSVDDLHTHNGLAEVEKGYFVFTLSSPSSWNNDVCPIWQAPSDSSITLTKIIASVIGSSTPLLKFNLEERLFTNINFPGKAIFSSDIVANTNGITKTIFSNEILEANSYLVFVANAFAESGTVDFLTGTVYFSKS